MSRPELLLRYETPLRAGAVAKVRRERDQLHVLTPPMRRDINRALTTPGSPATETPLGPKYGSSVVNSCSHPPEPFALGRSGIGVLSFGDLGATRVCAMPENRMLTFDLYRHTVIQW